MKVKFLFIAFLISMASCNPYKGFKGVDDKGMGRKAPSIEMTESFEKVNKKNNRKMKRKMKKRQKRMGAPIK